MNYKLIILLLLLCSTANAQNLAIDFRHIDPLDTLDEDDVLAMRDTSKVTRINKAKEGPNINALDYVLRDRYAPKHHSFDKSWYDHMYVGAGFGMERISPQQPSYAFRALTQANIFIGKEFDKKNSLRLSLGGAWGYQEDKNFMLRRASMNVDYLYNLSTHFAGYNPARRVEASLMFGLGANLSWINGSPVVFSPEGRFGVQLKCVTGPLGTFSLEPYVGLSADNIDASGTRNWRRYDFIYGMNLNYGFYLVDNLSKEARQELLQSRLANDRMVNKNTLEKWRTPWFIEYAMGPVMTSSPEMSFGATLGNQSSLSVGRWLSPVIGFRASASTRSTRWMQSQLGNNNAEPLPLYYNAHYMSGRIEALFNPFGFAKSFSWNARYGAYITFGGEFGTLTKYMPLERLRTYSEAYSAGAHFWYALSNDLQAFIEPRYTHNVYTIPYSNVAMRKLFGDNSFGINIGVTMLIRSEKYHNPEEMDDTQNYTYRDIRGFRVGLGGGMPILQRQGAYGTNGANANVMAFLEYRFNHLHSVRGHAEYLSINGTDGYNIYSRKNVFAALDYSISLSNLCTGRIRERRFELEAFAGPALGFMGGGTQNERSKPMAGANLGFKLSAHIWNGISAFITPTAYLLYSKNDIPGANTLNIDGMRFYQTLNVGIQYKVGKLRFNPIVTKYKRIDSDRNWKKRQEAAERKYAERLEKIQEKRRAKYENSK